MFSSDFSETIDYRRNNNLEVDLDLNALVIKFCLPYLLGNRTLIKNVLRTPWMSDYKGKGEWEPHFLPEHGNLNPEKEKFVVKLKNALLNEASEYLVGKKNIGILLSGGMDSRILAGVLRELELKSDKAINIIALSWGDQNSRDVIYAHRIAKKFNWDIKHYPITVETLAKNIKFSGQNGAEFSPFHLHAMEEVSKTHGIDVIIAGSYGDSVGRAEFSGKHLTKLKSLVPGSIDPYGFLKLEVINNTSEIIQKDLKDTTFFEGDINLLRRREIEQEMHYMRRMLQACMQTISLNIPVHQLFTSVEVFGLMWSLDPTYRNNNWYKLLLEELPGNLLDIPWARNGKLYDAPNEKPLDNFSNRYHQYGKWFRNDLRDDVLKRIYSNNIQKLNIFNDKGLDRLVKVWSKSNTNGITIFDEYMGWLCSLNDMMDIYSISSPNCTYQESNIDWFRGNYGALKAQSFLYLRNKVRK
ncbi:asparagine synthase-related protein [Acinetobacter towneri]|uniref:asparagine synthase-related protein n=1 Tax=Acinetobacter towneri TaxID=202956 RepID=UPI002097B761|nr:asparagine synthase-related protein [Acinetobacter towneri]MCO8048559.1 asparagine synthase-related protein [Acinetobacter towneri]